MKIRGPIIELHNGRPTLRHYLSNTTLDHGTIKMVIWKLGGWPLATSFEEIVKDPGLVVEMPHAKEILTVAMDYVAMIERARDEE